MLRLGNAPPPLATAPARRLTTAGAGAEPRSRRRMLAGVGLAVGLMAVQITVVRLSPMALPVRLTLPVTILATPLALWPYRRRLGVWVVLVGVVANLTPILANGGLMPIERVTVAQAIGHERAATYPSGQWIEGSKDVLVTDGGRLTALGDSIVLRIRGGGLVVSPGDVVIAVGLLLVVGEVALGRLRGKARSWPSSARRQAEGRRAAAESGHPAT